MEKAVKILSVLLCLSIITIGVFGYLYNYSQNELKLVKEKYVQNYNDGYGDGYDEGYASAKDKYISHGNTGSTDSYPTDDVETTVYITDTGRKYHQYGCQYLQQSCNAISLSDAEWQGYGPCSRCY